MSQVFRFTKLRFKRLLTWCILLLFRWAYLEVHTNGSYDDHSQALAAGMAEGYLSNDLIAMRYQNEFHDYCKKEKTFCDKLKKFLHDNSNWIQKNIKSHKDSSYWHQVYMYFFTVIL